MHEVKQSDDKVPESRFPIAVRFKQVDKYACINLIQARSFLLCEWSISLLERGFLFRGMHFGKSGVSRETTALLKKGGIGDNEDSEE